MIERLSCGFLLGKKGIDLVVYCGLADFYLVSKQGL